MPFLNFLAVFVAKQIVTDILIKKFLVALRKSFLKLSLNKFKLLIFISNLLVVNLYPLNYISRYGNI